MKTNKLSIKTKIILDFHEAITGDMLRKIAVFIGNHISIELSETVYGLDMHDILYKRAIMDKPKREYIYMIKGFCIGITESDVHINVVNRFNDIEETI